MKQGTEIARYEAPEGQDLLEVVRALEAEKQAFVAQTKDIEAKAAFFESKAASLEARASRLEETVQLLTRLLYGAKRERFVQENPLQLSLPFEVDEATVQKAVEAEKERVSYERKKNTSKPNRELVLSDKLPVEEVVIDVEGDKSNLTPIGEEVTRELKIAPARLFVLKIVRKKYLTKPDEKLAQTQVVAPLDRPMPKCMASPELLAHIVVEKFVFHTPVYRQLARFKQNGADIPASTADSWLSQLASHISPLHAAHRQYVLGNHYLQVDESPIRVLDRDKEGASHQGYMWVYRAPLQGAVLFDYRRGRGQEYPEENLKHFKGYLQTDGYAAYGRLAKREGVTHLGCWAHARRYFERALDNDKERASTVLALVQELYAVEREIREAGLAAGEIHALRLDKSLPILNRIGKYISEHYKQVLPKSPIGKALAYCLNQWDGLMNYLKDGHLEVDNNLIENSIRPLALGRKNYLFAGSHAAAEHVAMYYGFFATCKVHGINPEKWLTYVINHIQDTKTSELKNLLPQFFDKSLLG